MNNVVGPIFNEKTTEKWNLWVREQCTNHCLSKKSQHLRLLFMQQCMNSSRITLKRVKTNKQTNKQTKKKKKEEGRVYYVHCSVGPMPKTQTLNAIKRPNQTGTQMKTFEQLWWEVLSFNLFIYLFIFVDNSIVTMEKRMTNFNYKRSYSLRLQLLLKKLTWLHNLII